MGQLDTTWVVSDTHFGHSNVLKPEYDARPWPDIESHDEALIANWNAVVKPGEIVWHLGDVARTHAIAYRIIPRLNGSIRLIRGNHDDDLWKRRKRLPLFAEYHEAKYLRLQGETFYLHHYSCRTWRNSNHGGYHIFAHSHGALPRLNRSLDAGVNVNYYKPINLQWIINELRDAPFTDQHANETRTD